MKLYVTNEVVSKICIVPVHTNTNFTGNIFIEVYNVAELEYRLLQGAYNILDVNTHILTVVEGFTKYLFVRAVTDLSNDKKNYDFSVPARIVSDHGTSFTSSEFKLFVTRTV